jgi:hypothetical protein
MELQLTRDGAGFLGQKRLIERGRFVRVQIVEDDTDDFGLRIALDDMRMQWERVRIFV